MHSSYTTNFIDIQSFTLTAYNTNTAVLGKCIDPVTHKNTFSSHMLIKADTNSKAVADICKKFSINSIQIYQHPFQLKLY